jgi:uncharacterized protein
MVEARVRYLPVKIKGRPGFKMAYWDIDSGKEGPCLLVTAALHGNEVQGSEVIRRFCPMAGKNIVKGRMLLVPFANPLALWNRRPHIASTLAMPKGKQVERIINGKKMMVPDSRKNINCTWPGKPGGNEAEQMSYILFKSIVQQATHNIDLHCWNRFWVTAALPRNEANRIEFAKAGALPFVIPRPYVPTDRQGIKNPCTLTTLFNDTGRMAFAVEFSGQYAVIEKEVKRGVRMLSNCSKYLGMFRGKLEGLEERAVLKDEKKPEVVVVSPGGGLFVENGLSTGDFVKKGSFLGTLFDDRTLKTVGIKAPADGYLYAYGRHSSSCDGDLAGMHPYAEKGDTLAIIVAQGKEK